MASRERLIVVGKRTTVLLLLLVSMAIVGVTVWLSGKAYSKVDPVPFRDIRVLQRRLAEGPIPVSTFTALISPIILNMLLFVPWGFLMFIVLDNPKRPTFQSYLLTFLIAVSFSASVEAWQYFLPTRVTDINDVIWNGSGAVVGAILGHLRKRVRVSFE
ncbi:MAG: VanZ family protein [Acidobacteriota bacterium]